MSLDQLCQELRDFDAKVSVAYDTDGPGDEIPWLVGVWVAVDPSLRTVSNDARPEDIASSSTARRILVAQEYDETIDKAVEQARASAGVTALLHYPERIRHWTFAKDDELVWVPILTEQAKS